MLSNTKRAELLEKIERLSEWDGAAFERITTTLDREIQGAERRCAVRTSTADSEAVHQAIHAIFPGAR
jgi:hypothetical protein